MPSNNCVFKCCVLLFISITLTYISSTHSQCIECNASLCSNPIDCPHGFAEDDCQCCKLCLRQRGEPCGPNIGKCVKGLKCLSSRHLDPVLTNLVISDKETGICGVLNCTGVKCHNTGANDNIKCQNDSYKLLSSGSDSCCQTTCVCLPGICNTSQTRCPHNTRTQVVRAGNGMPGSCCDIIECVEAPTKCIHNSVEYMSGDKWKSDKCTTCECRDGLTFCQKKECRAVTNCNAMAVINDECCPTCQGCISSKGVFYNNTHNWYENDCMHCECNNGKISCKAHLCSPIYCDQMIRIDGQCCPVCANSTCDIQCPYGYKRDPFGQEICECNVCPINCNMYCPHGFVRGADGCDLCQCQTLANTPNNQIEDVTEAEEKSCITSNGTLIGSGGYWNDGCRDCFCNSGKIMCTKPHSCPPIRCSNAILIDGKCCAVCSDNQSKDVDEKNGSMETHIHSHLFITAIILTLIIAILLLGIFLLLAVYIMKKYPHFKYPRNRVINRSAKENAIIHLWPYSQSSSQAPEVQEKQFISIRVGNENNLLNNESLQIEDVGHSLQEKLLTTCTCPD